MSLYPILTVDQVPLRDVFCGGAIAVAVTKPPPRARQAHCLRQMGQTEAKGPPSIPVRRHRLVKHFGLGDHNQLRGMSLQVLKGATSVSTPVSDRMAGLVGRSGSMYFGAGVLGIETFD